jgi:glycosyltransferase involved in cell wall biosynthesis
MRILQAIDCYPPPLIGGHALQVRMTAQELARRGHDVEVAALAGPQGPVDETDGDVTVHRLEGWSRALSRFSVEPERALHPTIADPGLVRSIGHLLERFRPDVVHAHGWILHSLLPLLPDSCTRLVVTMHEYGLVCPKNSFVHEGTVCSGPGFNKCVVCASEQYGPIPSVALTTGLTLTRRSKRRVDQYIAVSSPVARACSALVAGGTHTIKIIPPFVPDATFDMSGADRPDFVPSSGGYVMFAGALGPHKGVDVLLEAWKRLEGSIPLVLVGLRRHDTPTTMPAGVTVVENVPHGEVLKAWNHCTVAVVPSRWPDPSPLVALEAMAAGRPVIASSVGGLPDIVQDGITGVLVPPGDVDALRAAMTRLLADPDLRTQMGEAAHQRAVKYSASTVVPQLESVYHQVINSPPPHSRPGIFNVFR